MSLVIIFDPAGQTYFDLFSKISPHLQIGLAPNKVFLVIP